MQNAILRGVRLDAETLFGHVQKGFREASLDIHLDTS